jgi:hypothetical protein
MTSILFLLAALAFSVLGTFVLVMRNRRPQRVEFGVRQFSREMRALAPDHRRAAPPARTWPDDGPADPLIRG